MFISSNLSKAFLIYKFQGYSGCLEAEFASNTLVFNFQGFPSFPFY